MLKNYIKIIYKIIKIEIIYKILFYLFLFYKKKNNPKIISTYNLVNEINKLKKNGLIKLDDFYDREYLKKVNSKFTEHALNSFADFKFTVHPSFKHLSNIDKNNINYYEVQKLTNYIYLKEPLLFLDDILILLNNQKLLFLLQDYFSCIPKLTGINIRRSFVNNLSDMETNHYHRDENSYNFLKMFIYLNDVNLDGGPFTYVVGSHKDKNKIQGQYHFNDAQINNKYLKDNIFYATANLGDIIIANTRALHKGTKVEKKERTMITFNFGIHPDYFDFKSRINLNQTEIKKLSSLNKLFFN
jgi:hypothetical protein